jgi:hypothetical protein
MEMLRWGYDFSRIYTPFFFSTGGRVFPRKECLFFLAGHPLSRVKSQKWQYSGNFYKAKEKGLKLLLPKSLILLVGQGRIELPTLGFSVRY